MADQVDKDLEDAAKAYAAASEAVPAKAEGIEAPTKPAPLKAELVKTELKPAPVLAAAPAVETPPVVQMAPAKKIIPAKAKAPKPIAKTKPVAKPLASKPAPKTPKVIKTKTELRKAAASTKPITALKELIMAKTPDFTKTVTDAVAELQTKAKAAYDKSTEVAGEVTEFTKGNVEAMVESGKIFSEGFQDLGKTYAEEAKSAFETATADLKEMAAIKSPTELFQLQGKLARRNFDSLVAFSSKSSEAFVKLANEGFAPLSSRVSLAADKVSKAA